MNIDVPGLTPEMCQARADWLRLHGKRAVVHPEFQALDVVDAAIIEQYPPKPELKVGDLARLGPGKVRVDFIGRHRAFITYPDGDEASYSLDEFTPTGEPAPDDWGQ